MMPEPQSRGPMSTSPRFRPGLPLAGALIVALLALMPGCPAPPAGNQNSSNTNASNSNSNPAANENLNFNAPTPPTQVQLTAMAQTGDVPPGQASGAAFRAFSDPRIDPDGRVAFWAQYRNGAGNGGLYVWSEGTLSVVVDDDPNERGIVPGRETQDYFGNFAASSSLSDPLRLPFAWGPNGNLYFAAPIAGETESKGIYRWNAGDQTITRIADLEQVTALFRQEFGNAVLDWTMQPFTVDDDGVVFFTVRYTLLGTNVPGQIAFGQGVFRADGTTITVVRDRYLEDADVPGQPAAARFTGFADLTTQDPAGDGFFQATYSGGAGTRGLFMARDNDVYVVIDNRPNSRWVGLTNGTVVGASNAIATAVTASNTHIALDTQIQVGSATNDAILHWSWARRRWTRLLGGDASNAETLLTGVTNHGQCAYLANGRPHISNGQTVTRLDNNLPSPLSTGTIRWEPSGSISTFGRVLLRYTRNPSSAADSAEGLALWTGAGLIVVTDRGVNRPDDQIRQVSFATGPEQDRAGRSGAINDADRLTFRAVRPGSDGQLGNDDDIQTVYFAVATP
jgi:hypothetical protein